MNLTKFQARGLIEMELLGSDLARHIKDLKPAVNRLQSLVERTAARQAKLAWLLDDTPQPKEKPMSVTRNSMSAQGVLRDARGQPVKPTAGMTKIPGVHGPVGAPTATTANRRMTREEAENCGRKARGDLSVQQEEQLQLEASNAAANKTWNQFIEETRRKYCHHRGGVPAAVRRIVGDIQIQ